MHEITILCFVSFSPEIFHDFPNNQSAQVFLGQCVDILCNLSASNEEGILVIRFNNETLDSERANDLNITYSMTTAGEVTATASFLASKMFNNSKWQCSFCHNQCQNPSEYFCSGMALLKIQGKKFLLPIFLHQTGV